MNFNNPGFWLDALQWLVVLALAAVTWLRKPGADAKRAVEELGERIEREQQAMQIQIQKLEDHVAHMPTDQELESLRGDVHSIKAQLEGQRELLKRVEHQTTLIHEHLLRSK